MLDSSQDDGRDPSEVTSEDADNIEDKQVQIKEEVSDNVDIKKEPLEAQVNVQAEETSNGENRERQGEQIKRELDDNDNTQVGDKSDK